MKKASIEHEPFRLSYAGLRGDINPLLGPLHGQFIE